MKNKSYLRLLTLPLAAVIITNSFSLQEKKKRPGRKKLPRHLTYSEDVVIPQPVEGQYGEQEEAQLVQAPRFIPDSVPMTRFGLISTHFEILLFFILIILFLILNSIFNLKL